MRRLGGLITSLLAGCASPPPLIEWHASPGVVPAEYYVWHLADDLDDFRTRCDVKEGSVVYNGGACTFAPTHNWSIVPTTARRIDNDEPVREIAVGALCIIVTTVLKPTAQFWRSIYPGDGLSLFRHELEHCLGRSHTTYTADELRGVR